MDAPTQMRLLKEDNLQKINQQLEKMNPAEILSWAVFQQFRSCRIAATSSFQSQSRPLLYLISRVCPAIPVYFLDTGYHFQQTLSYVQTLKNLLGLNLRSLTPLQGGTEDRMYKTDPDMCCYLRKVEPLQREFRNIDLWISGIRRDQTLNRSKVKILDFQERLNVFKLSPMANVTAETLAQINLRIQLPEHPLEKMGYTSIGCEPCTTLPTGENERSGRWANNVKTECGLHYNSNP
jgi:phosphoadenosine phosphosulfate reductase